MSLYLAWLDQEFQNSLQRWRNKKPDELWVSDLVSCRIKEQYSRMMPAIRAADDAYSGALVLGKLAHLGFQGLWVDDHEYRVKQIASEIELSLRVDGRLLRGRMDMACAILNEDREAVALEFVELKTGRDVKDVTVYRLMLDGGAEIKCRFNEETERLRDLLGRDLPVGLRIAYATSGRPLVTPPVTQERAERAVRSLYGVAVNHMDLADIIGGWLDSKTPLLEWGSRSECDRCPFASICAYCGVGEAEKAWSRAKQQRLG